jgi:hypothetical protein
VLSHTTIHFNFRLFSVLRRTLHRATFRFKFSLFSVCRRATFRVNFRFNSCVSLWALSRDGSLRFHFNISLIHVCCRTLFLATIQVNFSLGRVASRASSRDDSL